MLLRRWVRGSVLQGVSALVRLASGLLFAWLLLDAFGTSGSGTFWATAVAYQIAFTLCGFGLPYGIVQRQGSDYAFLNPEVRAALALILLTMVALLLGLWLALDRDLLGAAIGLHYLVNRLVFMVIFFRRNALEFERALYQQLAYDTSVNTVLVAAWATDMSFDNFATTLMVLNIAWFAILIWTAQLANQSVAQLTESLGRAFTKWRVFSARTYSTEAIGLILNGLDRVVLAALGQAEFLAIYVLARKFYEVPHNIMAAQSSFVFAIMVKLSGQGSSSTGNALIMPPAQLARTRLVILLSYEALAILGYGLLALLFLQFGLIDHAGDFGALAAGLVSIFLVIGVAQASLIPILNLTYAQGNARFILNYTLANAAIGGGLLLVAWMQESTWLVFLSQSVIVLTSWCFMAAYLLREFGPRLGGVIALAKLVLLVALHVWFVQVDAYSIPSLP